MNDLEFHLGLWTDELDFDTRLAWLAMELESTTIEVPEGEES